MDNIQFLAKFVSDDSTRYAITGVYRDKQALVSTNGHVMTWIETKGEATPGYVDGIDRGEYPNWQCVLPKGEFEVTASIASSDIAKKLKFLAKDRAILKLEIDDADIKIKTLAQALPKNCDSYRHGTERLGYQLTADLAKLEDETREKLADLRDADKAMPTPAFLASDLLTVIEAIVDKNIAGYNRVEIAFNLDHASMIKLKWLDRHAIIMPMRQE